MTETNTDHHLGDMLRQHRESIGLSVRTLATKAGFSPSFISQVENGLASPSIGSLEKIAACLDVTLSELFRHQNEPLSGVVRVKDRPRLASGWSKAEIESLAFDRASRLAPTLITLQPGGASGKRSHSVKREQFVFVINGQVNLSLNGTDQVLAKGDAVTIRPDTPLLWSNRSSKTVQLLIVSNLAPASVTHGI